MMGTTQNYIAERRARVEQLIRHTVNELRRVALIIESNIAHNIAPNDTTASLLASTQSNLKNLYLSTAGNMELGVEALGEILVAQGILGKETLDGQGKCAKCGGAIMDGDRVWAATGDGFGLRCEICGPISKDGE